MLEPINVRLEQDLTCRIYWWIGFGFFLKLSIKKDHFEER